MDNFIFSARETMGKVFGKVVDHEKDIGGDVLDSKCEAFYRQILPPEGEFTFLQFSAC